MAGEPPVSVCSTLTCPSSELSTPELLGSEKRGRLAGAASPTDGTSGVALWSRGVSPPRAGQSSSLPDPLLPKFPTGPWPCVESTVAADMTAGPVVTPNVSAAKKARRVRASSGSDTLLLLSAVAARWCCKGFLTVKQKTPERVGEAACHGKSCMLSFGARTARLYCGRIASCTRMVHTRTGIWIGGRRRQLWSHLQSRMWRSSLM